MNVIALETLDSCLKAQRLGPQSRLLQSNSPGWSSGICILTSTLCESVVEKGLGITAESLMAQDDLKWIV